MRYDDVLLAKIQSEQAQGDACTNEGSQNKFHRSFTIKRVFILPFPFTSISSRD
jgi:hypothetical protein